MLLNRLITKYDHTGSRVAKTSGGTTTHYPNQYYEVTTGTTTKYVYTPDSTTLLATIESMTPAPRTSYHHLDHLASAQVSTGGEGYLTAVYGYYP